MKVHHPFKITLLHYTVPNWSYYKPILLESLPPYERNGDTVSTDYLDKSKSKYFDIFDKFIEPVLTEFRRDIGHEVYIRNVWTQRAKKRDHHCPHNHGSSGWAAVLYADYNPDIHSATTFISPFTEFSSGDHMDFTPNVKREILFSFLLNFYIMLIQTLATIISFNMMGTNEIDIF